MKKKIILTTEYLYPNNLSTAYYLTNIAEIFCNNYNCKVITTTELGSVKELPFLEKRITRLKDSSFSNNNVISRIFRSLLFTLKLTWTTFFALKKDDVMFSVTNPAFIIVLLAVVKKIKKAHYTLLVYDVFPENALAAGLIKNDSFIYKISKRIFDWAYCQADRLIVIGRDMEELIGEKTNNQTPMTLITNWADTELVVPMPKNENLIINKFNLEEKIVFSFTGNLGRVQGIQNLLDAAQLVTNKSFVLLLIGDGAMRSIVEEYVINHPGGNVIYGGSYPASEQNVFLNACDIAIVSLNPSMYGLGVPSKSYYNMAAGKPLLYIGDENSEMGRVVTEQDIGWIIEPDDAKKLAQLFEIISKDSSLYEKGKKSRETVEKYYSKGIVLAKYKKLYSEEP
jgi:glycosyltransferase involved in cell wall biosynthesis